MNLLHLSASLVVLVEREDTHECVCNVSVASRQSLILLRVDRTDRVELMTRELETTDVIDVVDRAADSKTGELEINLAVVDGFWIRLLESVLSVCLTELSKAFWIERTELCIASAEL